jgi:hypothetical protein
MRGQNTIRMLGAWVNERRIDYLRIHDAVFKQTLRPIPFDEHLRALEGIASELESVDGATPYELPFPLSPAEEEFLEVLQPYLMALTQAIRGLASICSRLATEARGTRTAFWTFRDDVRQYEVVAGGYAKLGWATG